MEFNDFIIGKKAFILAEIGNNHNGDFNQARQMVIEAAKAGADGVKLQTFTPEKLVHKDSQVLPAAQSGKHKTQYDRLNDLKLTHGQFIELRNVASKLGVIFLSTPFDEESVDFLEELVPFYKVSSGDLNNTPLLKHIASKRKPVLLSTGMANEEDIHKALNVFNKKHLVLLHCVSRYPTPLEEANLLSIPFMKDKFNVPVGYSDHTIGLTACMIATSLGAVIIEKHFTLDKNNPIGDHRLSMDPTDLKTLVYEVNQIKKSLGTYGKPIASEKEAATMLRRSLYAKINIPRGTTLKTEMIVALRPAHGLPPEELNNLVGMVSNQDIKKDTLITKRMLN